MRRSFALGLSLVGAAMAGLSVAGAGAAAAVGNLGDALEPTRTWRNTTVKRGKHAARRHGAKLRTNRSRVSKRTRAKHRKAAKR